MQCYSQYLIIQSLVMDILVHNVACDSAISSVKCIQLRH